MVWVQLMRIFTGELGSPARAMAGKETGLGHTMIGTFVVDTLALILGTRRLPQATIISILHWLNPLLRVMNDTLNGMPAIMKGLLHCRDRKANRTFRDCPGVLLLP